MSKAIALPGVQPTLLKWARETAHLTVEDVALSFKKQPEDIEAWETGNAWPTYAQLEKLAYELYKRPLACFFLPAPPPEKAPEADFRALPYADLRQLQRSTVLLIRKARAYQKSLEELFAGRSPVANPIWRKIALDPAKPVGPQAQAVRAGLAVPDVGAAVWGGSDGDAALKAWRKAIEAAGVFVFKDTFKQKEISGFCLEHPELPVVMINNSTTKTRQIFSLLHELAHILLGRQAISTFSDEPLSRLPPGEQRIERFCNRVAAEVLVPHDNFVAFTRGLVGAVEDWPADRFATIAERYRVSREVILRMFRDADRVSQDFYDARKAEWDGQKAGKSKGGGDHYNTRGVYISERLMSEVLMRYGRRQIDVAEAADFMGVKAKHIDEFENRYLAGLAA
jgi:Zn-dependent peptidase ImmA (M78 family)/transcriptional regulator with XRE-family HTH domain